MMALALMLGCVAWAETDMGMFEFSFGDFSMMLPEDLYAEIADAIENNVVFFQVNEDYDPEAVHNANLNCLWSKDTADIDLLEPTALAREFLEMCLQGYEAIDISVVDPTLYGAEYFELSGKHAMTALYSFTLDFSPRGEDLQYTAYSLVMFVPVNNGETYIFTLTAMDLYECEKLVAVLNSLEWLV